MRYFSPLFASLALASGSTVSYDGVRVVRLPTGDDSERISDIIKRLELDTWKQTDSFADIVVPLNKLDAFNYQVTGLDATTMHKDLGASIAVEKRSVIGTEFVQAETTARHSWFERYHVYKHHLDWLFTLQRQYPNNSRISYSGASFEGNNITGIHIFGSSGGGVKPAVVLHGTVHAREWITGKVVEYLAYTLLSKYSVDSQIRDFVEKYDFYVFPIVNPDGFIHTHKDRMWRKTRQKEPRSTCLGRDVNRNWPFHWDAPGGSSTDPCAEDFRGQGEGDALETQALIKKLEEIKQQQGLKLYIDWHSYSQLFMWPYGYSCDKLPNNHEELQALAKGAVAEMAKPYGTAYTAGPICPTIYMASGSSVDYVQNVIGGDYVYAIELRDKGRHGFLLPKEEILSTSKEAFEGLKYLLENME